MPDPQTKTELAVLIERVESGEHTANLAAAVAERLGVDYGLAAQALGKSVRALGAVASLVERVHPGWMWFVKRYPNDGPAEGAVLEPDGDYLRADRVAEAPTPARALFLALLKSLDQAQLKDTG